MRLADTPNAAEVVILSGTTAPGTPLLAGAVPDGWANANAGVVPSFVVDFEPAGTVTEVSNAYLLAAFLDTGVIADTTFTASGATLTDNAHGLNTGDGPVRVSSSDTLPAGLSAGTDYYIINLSANTYSLATSRANAFAGTAVTTTDAGTGTHTLADTADTKIVKWKRWGTLFTTAPTLSARLGYAVEVDHDPRAVAYGVTWTGTAGAALRVAMCPRVFL